MVSHERSLGCILCLITVAVVACQPGPAPDPNDPTTFDDAAHPELCPDACARWERMGCKEAMDVCDQYKEPEMTCAMWITCEEWCVELERTASISLNLECIVNLQASSCDALAAGCSVS